MIFVTVGTQLHFDRMIETVDKWAANVDEQVFCQTGPTSLVLKGCQHREFLSPAEFNKYMEKCSVLVSHAGIGSILSAMKYRKPILIYPRRASLGEHRNEHQLATARSFEGKPGIYVAYERDELLSWLNQIHELEAHDYFRPYAEDRLIEKIKSFIHS